MKRVFIAGATGYLGRYLVEEFGANGWEVCALVRDAQKASKSGLIAEKIVQGQATDPNDLIGKMAGVDLVISTLGITRQKDGLSYLDVDYQANLNLLKEAEQAGVKRFCYVHVLNADYMNHVALVAAKQAFVDELRASHIASTVVAPSGYFSDMGDILQMARSGRVFLFGDGEKHLNPIHGADLAVAIREGTVVGQSEMSVGGPDTLSQNDIAQLAFEALGKRAKIIHLPESLIGLALWLLTTFTPQKFYGPYQFFLSALRMDMTTEQYGQRHLSDHFAKLGSEPKRPADGLPR